MAQKHDKPFLLIDLSKTTEDETIHQWIDDAGLETLNVAGPRESSHSGVFTESRDFLIRVLGSYSHYCQNSKRTRIAMTLTRYTALFVVLLVCPVVHAHPGHALSERGIAHWISSPYHLLFPLVLIGAKHLSNRSVLCQAISNEIVHFSKLALISAGENWKTTPRFWIKVFRHPRGKMVRNVLASIGCGTII